MRSRLFLFAGIITVFILIIFVGGAIDVINRGGGFLFIASFTPTSTNTPTLTNTPTATNTSTLTDVPTKAPTLTPTCTATITPSPTNTDTVQPTIDVTALAKQIRFELSETEHVIRLSQTPSVTPTLTDSELFTGVRDRNKADNKELYYIKIDDDNIKSGFWLDYNEVSNREYMICLDSGICSEPGSTEINGIRYFGNKEYDDYPMVNVTKSQAQTYCAWAGMNLMNLDDYYEARDIMPSEIINVNLISDGPLPNNRNNSNIIGNVWEFVFNETDIQGTAVIVGGSWKTSLHDVSGQRSAKIRIDGFADDVGFRCVSYVFKR